MKQPLSNRLLDIIRALFSEDNYDVAKSLLHEFCNEEVASDPALLERIRTAALKSCKGSVERLADCIELAHLDWRDLLVGAGFADEPDSHKNWFP